MFKKGDLVMVSNNAPQAPEWALAEFVAEIEDGEYNFVVRLLDVPLPWPTVHEHCRKPTQEETGHWLYGKNA